MFDGEPIDSITKELLITSLRNGMELAKRISKKQKNKKDE